MEIENQIRKGSGLGHVQSWAGRKGWGGFHGLWPHQGHELFLFLFLLWSVGSVLVLHSSPQRQPLAGEGAISPVGRWVSPQFLNSFFYLQPMMEPLQWLFISNFLCDVFSDRWVVFIWLAPCSHIWNFPDIFLSFISRLIQVGQGKKYHLYSFNPFIFLRHIMVQNRVYFRECSSHTWKEYPTIIGWNDLWMPVKSNWLEMCFIFHGPMDSVY